MNSPSLLKTCGAVMIAAILAMVSTAVLGEKPPRCDEADNNQLEKNPLKTCEEKLNDEQSALLTEMEELVVVLEDMPGFRSNSESYVDSSTGEEGTLWDHLGRMRRQQEEGAEIIAETEEAEFEDMVIHGGKKKGQNCELEEALEVKDFPEDFLPAGFSSPSIELGNTVCDRFKAFDDDKEKWVWISERSQPNICLRVCGDREVLDTESQTSSLMADNNAKPKKKDKIRNRHVERRSEGIDSARKSKQSIAAAKEDLEFLNVMTDTFGSAYATSVMFPKCELPDDKVQYDRWLAKEILVPILIGLKINSRVAEGVQDSAWAICQQTVFGANASVTCVPAILYKQISLGLVDVMDFVLDEIDLAMEGFDLTYSDVTHECVASIREEQAIMMGLVSGMDGIIRSINAKAGNTAAGITELKRTVMENREYILNNRMMLLTPHGKRDDLALYEAPPPPPAIVSVEGEAGSSTLKVNFTEGVWTEIGQSGNLVAEDFNLTNNAPSDPESIKEVGHVAGAKTATLTLSKSLDGDEFGVDALSAKADAIFNEFDIPMDDSIEKYVE